MSCQRRVLIVMRGDSLFGGGAERRFWRLFTHLRKSGHDVHLLINRSLLESLQKIDPGEHVSQRSLEGIHVYEDNSKLGGKIVKILGFNLFAIQTIRALRPSVVHLVLIQRSLIPLYMWLLIQRSVRVVHTMAMSLFAYPARVPLSTALCAKLIWRRADVIDSLYPSFAHNYGRRYQNKIVVTPCSFTNTEEFKPANQKKNMIVFAGRFIEEKNPLLLVKALTILRSLDADALSGWEIVFLGEGPLGKELWRQIIQNDLANVVRVERANCISSYLREARVFVSLQRTENYPSQALLEAMSAGCAVIATDVGETRRLVDERTGLLVENDNPIALANALRELMNDPQRCQCLGQAARARVLAEHSLARFADYMCSLWKETYGKI